MTHDTATAHPLRSNGPARKLYAFGLAVDLTGMLLLLLVGSGLIPTTTPVQVGSFFLALGLQPVAQRLRSRAWWHLPLRDAGPVPDRVELAYWTVCAAVIVVSAAVQSFGRAPELAFFGPWVLAFIATGWALMPTMDRPRPEPPAAWWAHTVPLLAATSLVLVLGVAGGAMNPIAATLFAVAVVVGGVVARRRARKTPTS